MRIHLARIFLFSGLVVLLVLVAPGKATAEPPAVPAYQANLLQNPGFEEPYSAEGAAANWARWHQELNSNPKPEGCSDYYLVLPKWGPESASSALIYEGVRAQHIGNEWDTWRAGVMQTVNVNPGSTYRFSFFATGRAASEQYPAPSNTSVNLGVRGGIDPNGSGLWSDGDIVWGAAGSPHMSGGQGAYQQFSVQATATAGKISVFVQADTGGAGNCYHHLDVWFDKAELVEVGPPPTNTPPPPPPPPPATNTPPPPTETPTPEFTPTFTATPTETPTNTPTPIQTGIICTNAFADSNGNGQRDPEEGYMAGVTFVVGQGGQVVAPQGISTGSETPVCFENLMPGDYVVAQQIPRHLVMTTAPSANITVSSGTTISLEYGSWFRQQEEEQATVTPEPVQEDVGSETNPTDEGPELLTIVGLGAIALAILMMGVIIFILLRQQRGSSG